MSGIWTRQAGWRRVFVTFAVLALAMKILIPPGFMPGTSLSQPIVLCPDQGPVPIKPPMAGMAMAPSDHGGHHDPTGHGHDGNDHPCAFAGVGSTSLAADLAGPAPLPASLAAAAVPAAFHTVAPGRGMAAPPPPSHAPPLDRA